MPRSVRTTSRKPKLGLALSGGGFRASFFHIGVLARLAELDLLRSVEVISTVSGGSIIGALYFLYLKKLLECIPDMRITGADYVKMIDEMTHLFVAGVRKNPRVLAFSNIASNFKLVLPSYSRSDRMSEIYHELFYDPASGRRNIPMRDLIIRPHPGQGFNPRVDNAGRKAKVPMLIINATTLNTGRTFQFTAVDMGERFPERQTLKYDKNPVLQAFRYDALPEGVPSKYKDVPLGIAVAASACVPGVFHPLALTKLYKKFTPQLVDGGVHDNQGLEALLYEGCTDIIVSDASGQMDKKANPWPNFLAVTLRANSILQNRVRNLGLEFLQAYAGIRQPILHLRAGLNVDVMKPGTSPTESRESVNNEQKREWGEVAGVRDNYGIPVEIQLALSKIRTDLDAFSDVEAQSLIFNGYRITEKDIVPEFVAKFATNNNAKTKRMKSAAHGFDEIVPLETGTKKSQSYKDQLASAKDVLFKIFNDLPAVPKWTMRILTGALWAVLAFAVCYGSYRIPYGLVFLLEYLHKLYWLWQTLFVVIIGTAFLMILVPILISFIAMAHLVLVNPVFLRRGKIDAIAD